MRSRRNGLTCALSLALVALPSSSRAAGISATDLAGSWRVLSARIFYDAGGGGAMNRGVGHTLDLTKDGEWSYASSSGTFKVQATSEADWKRWQTASYGPKQKVVLTGWKDGEASGPIEASGGGVDFVWVIYRVGPPLVQAPGLVHMKFGRVDP